MLFAFYDKSSLGRNGVDISTGLPVVVVSDASGICMKWK